MALSTRSLILLITLPVTVCAAILYYLHKKDEEWDDEVGVLSSKDRLIEVKVPSEKIACVIGRGGINIKKLQDQTNTKINFKDASDAGDDEEFRVCKIRGSPENTEKAEKLLMDLIYNQPEILTTDLWIPQSACGRLIGRCGENIKAISSKSNAHILVDTYNQNKTNILDSKGKPGERQVVIKGTAQEIAVALELVKKVVDDDRNTRTTLNSRQPRVQLHSNSTKNKNETGENGVASPDTPKIPADQPTLPEAEQLASIAGIAATSGDGMIQVYVSSVAHPHAFWVQLVSPRSVELDHLVEDMTEYYSKEESKALHRLDEVKVGQIVAAPFETDNRLYRVEVYGVTDKKAEDGSPLIDIFYLDYGDSGYIPLSQIFELRTDFLSLRFQAIECKLANIEMKAGEKEWSEEVISEFEQLVYSAQWKHIMVRLSGYSKRDKKPPVPVVKVFDPSTGRDAAEELIKRGLARAPDSVKPSLDVKPTIIPGLTPGRNTSSPTKPAENADPTSSFIQSESKSNKPSSVKPTDVVTSLIESESNTKQPASSSVRPSGFISDSTKNLLDSESNSNHQTFPSTKPSDTSGSKVASPAKPSDNTSSLINSDLKPAKPATSPNKPSDTTLSFINSGSKPIQPASSPPKPSGTTSSFINSGSKFTHPASSPTKSDATTNLIASESNSKEPASPSVKPSAPPAMSSFIEPGFKSTPPSSSPSKPSATSDSLTGFIESEKTIMSNDPMIETS